MPTFFVAGSTGYTGREVVRQLARRGERVVAHVRPDSPAAERSRALMSDDGAEVDVTPWEASAMRDTLARIRPDVVFALLGTTRRRTREAEARGGPVESYESVDYGLTVLLLEATAAAAPAATFVYLSALGVSASSASPYYAARARVEDRLRTGGLRYVVARPSFITGTDRGERRTGERFAARAVDGLLSAARVVGAAGLRLHDRYASIDAAGLAHALIALAITAPGSEGSGGASGASGTIVEAGELQRLARDKQGKMG